eukprot:TRINITY_DN86534_c0_g1_i1.p1 TRINITY_DN86534_c0_g1~~TRINITY_DN86534_c0_g1_i1.p1  ORF type:complete len:145 (+),score=21.94 TRINITY_DN86534_c0_g1_i1:49-483(+)
MQTAWRRCPVFPLEPQPWLQRRWRSHPKGGIYGPTYHHFPTEVKTDWPPKDRSQLFKLPESKRLMCVTHGWHYPNGITGRSNKKISTILSFASRHKHNHMDSLTVDEVKALEALVPTIKAQFAECKKKAEEETALDMELAHTCR